MKAFLNHLLAYKYIIISVLGMLPSLIKASGQSLAASLTKPGNHIDSISSEKKVREILTSQQLFMVKISSIKGKKSRFKFKAELRDAFLIVRYDGDKTITELNWTKCPNGNCPVPGQYNFGTTEYNQIDSLIVNAKIDAQKWQNEMSALKKNAGKSSNKK